MQPKDLMSGLLVPILISLSLGVVVSRACADPATGYPSTIESPINSQLRGLGMSAKLGGSKDLDDQQLQLMHSLGVSVVVWTPGEWAFNEKQPGQYTLDPEVLRVIQEMSKDNMQTVVALFRRNDIYGNPLDPAAFARYCGWMAEALKGQPIAAYQIWNEPSNFDFRTIYGGTWNGRGDAPWVDKFSDFMRQGAQAIRNADPNAKIIASFDGPASIYGLQRNPNDFQDLDGISLHPYSFKLPPERVPYGGTAIFMRDGVSIADAAGSLESTLRIQSIEDPKRYLGRSLETWVTEYGFPTCDPNSTQQFFACLSPEVQAAYHARGLVLGLAQGVKVWTPYELADEGQDAADAEQNFGLTRSAATNFARKPAFAAIQRIAQLLGSDWRYIAQPPARLYACNGAFCNEARSRSSVAGPQMFWFANSQKYVGFVWKAGEFEAGATAGRIGWLAPPNSSTTARLTDLVTGAVLTPATTSSKQYLLIDHVPIGSDPVAVEILNQ